MYGRSDSIPHIALFEALAELPDEHCPEWPLLSATLLCIRAVDLYTYPHPLYIEDAESPPPLEPTYRAVDAIDASDPARELLRAVLDALSVVPSGRRPTKVYRALIPFGRMLQSRGQWRVAADVYHTALRYGGFLNSVRRDKLDTLLHLGECHRHLMEWKDAEAVFARAARSATARGDIPNALRAQCYRASMIAERGDLVRAQERLRTVEADAQESNLPDIRALAEHARAHVAFLLGNYEDATRLAFRALQGLPDPVARERALSDLAAAFAELGVRPAARDAHLIIAATAQDPATRWTALINLMELAALDGMRAAFDQYRRELAAAQLPTRLAAYYHYYAGLGAHAFGELDDARAELSHALKIADLGKIEHLKGDAKAALHAIDSERAPRSVAPPRAPTPATAEIAGAIERMRHAVTDEAP